MMRFTIQQQQLLAALALFVVLARPITAQSTMTTPLGVDHSWPMQRPLPELQLDPKQAVIYQQFMDGCVEYYGRHLCEPNEQERIEFNAYQPAQMINYTELGFAHVRAPPAVYHELQAFWQHFNSTHLTLEDWPRGELYTNHWDSETLLLNVYREGGPMIPTRSRNGMINDLQAVLEEWSGQALSFSSMYGIRVYQNNSVLSTHVDRLPLVTSCIVNVAQDVEEAWPLEIIGHDGVARNITMEPGDMVLYESHSILHGRPYPMRGNYYANIFVHFSPYVNDEL